jgi:hypothetical protein
MKTVHALLHACRKLLARNSLHIYRAEKFYEQHLKFCVQCTFFANPTLFKITEQKYFCAV